ncbi:MAG: nitrate/sulfonate/bicarbonate ABC transporter ATP-binding protein [Pseudomonadota bacterium]
MSDAQVLSLANVSKTFRLESKTKHVVLKDVNFGVNENDMVALLGPSGSGKSTCLRIISGLIPPTSGDVLMRGEPLVGINHAASLVFQSFALFPWQTTYDNIALALEPLGLSHSEIRKRVRHAIDLVGLEGFEEAYPRELSGGMKQRVGIARALVMERPLLLLDEPFSSLDVLTAETLRSEVQNIFLKKSTETKSMILVTHNIQEAVFMANRILLMGMNPGHIRRDVENSLPFPRDDQSADFQRMVAMIRELVTEVLLPDAPPVGPGTPRVGREYDLAPPETIPVAHVNETIGLLEAVADEGGTANIFELAHRTGKEFGKTLLLVKVAELFNLVDTPRQSIVLTPLGRRFVAGDINVRKKILHDVFQSLRIVQMATDMLQIQGGQKMPFEDLLVVIQEWLPNENPKEVGEALITWGRFAEYFGYNDDTKEFYLDTGQEPA